MKVVNKKKKKEETKCPFPEDVKPRFPNAAKKNRAIGKKVHDVVNMGMWRR
jgi:hypothetical protein